MNLHKSLFFKKHLILIKTIWSPLILISLPASMHMVFHSVQYALVLHVHVCQVPMPIYGHDVPHEGTVGTCLYSSTMWRVCLQVNAGSITV
jgi:hypothetical protein